MGQSALLCIMLRMLGIMLGISHAWAARAACRQQCRQPPVLACTGRRSIKYATARARLTVNNIG